MKYTILKYGMLAGALLFGGCSNWLDVDPKSQVKQEVLFESEAGFQDALTGIYTIMARTDMYDMRRWDFWRWWHRCIRKWLLLMRMC